ncbi:MAG: hypothetical protein U0414_41655 [Polyangiaceae bacterium]
MIAFEVLEFALDVSTLPVSLALAVWLQRTLLRRMSARRRRQAWPEDEQLARLYAISNIPFGAFLSMIPFCVVTRRHKGALQMALAVTQGVVWAALLAATVILYSLLYGVLLGFMDPRLIPAVMGT